MTEPSDRIWLPHVLFELAETFGLPVALRFAAEFGGRRLAVPEEAHGDHPVARQFGIAVLEWMIDQWGPQNLLIPLGPQSSYNRRIGEIRRLLQAGEDAATIVRAVGCHERTIFRHRRTLKERRQDERQGALDLTPPDPER
jgi:hypothetical protein